MKNIIITLLFLPLFANAQQWVEPSFAPKYIAYVGGNAYLAIGDSVHYYSDTLKVVANKDATLMIKDSAGNDIFFAEYMRGDRGYIWCYEINGVWYELDRESDADGGRIITGIFRDICEQLYLME